MTLLNESYHVDMEFALFDYTVESVLENDIFLESEESSNKIGNAISRLIEKVKTFIQNAIQKIKSIFTSKKIEQSMEELNDAKSDPSVSSEKVEMIDIKTIDKDIDEYEKQIAVCNKKGNNVTKEDIEKLMKCKKKCSAAKPLITVGIIAGALGIGASMKTVHARMKKNQESLDRLKVQYKTKINDLEKKQENELSNAGNDSVKQAKVGYQTDIARAEIDLKYQEAKRDVLYSSWFNRLCTRIYHLKNGTVYTKAKEKDDQNLGKYQGNLDILQSDTYKDLKKNSAIREQQLRNQINELEKAVPKKTAENIAKSNPLPEKPRSSSSKKPNKKSPPTTAQSVKRTVTKKGGKLLKSGVKALRKMVGL